MGEIYEFLGLKVGLIQDNMGFEERSSLRLGPHLRHQRPVRLRLPEGQHSGVHGSLVQRSSTSPSWTRVDSILIDEARRPLIISGMLRAPPTSTASLL